MLYRKVPLWTNRRRRYFIVDVRMLIGAPSLLVVGLFLRSVKGAASPSKASFSRDVSVGYSSKGLRVTYALAEYLKPRVGVCYVDDPTTDPYIEARTPLRNDKWRVTSTSVCALHRLSFDQAVGSERVPMTRPGRSRAYWLSRPSRV